MTIGIIGATRLEMEYIKNRIVVDDTLKKAGKEFISGKLEGKDIAFVISGIGKVDVGITTQILIDDFDVDKIIFLGVAGAVNPDLNVSDVVVCVDSIQHDVDMKDFGVERGQFIFSNLRIYESDKRLVDVAIQASKKNGFNTSKGRVLSGDQFISDPKKSLELREELEGDCIEMEGAAMAHVCTVNEVSFVIIRQISDNADHSAKVNFEDFCKEASKNLYEILIGILSEL